MAVAFNEQVAGLFRDMADLLGQQDGNPFRINAYVRAAQLVARLDEDLREILEREGHAGLTRLPGIGDGLATSIEQIAKTGRLPQLDRLRGESDPERLFRTIPGVGPGLARVLHDTLHVDTLEALEVAAHDGRLEAVEGVGPRRADSIRAGLASLLGRAARRGPARTGRDEPGVSLLLEVDRDYRRRAADGKLPTISPRRFNPERKAWLPVLHTDRQGWHFTALYSNTARAHELGKTGDWVVIYFYDGEHHEGQHTVVTETHGPLEGRRVVRGREAESRAQAR